MKLNLDAKTNEERKVKAYLEANASEMLAEKINNGVRIQKDGKTLLNKKTLTGFLKSACDEAKKQAEKGAHSACIDDDVVYGWAVHYFEEDSIEGTLYNEDGTEYKKQPGVATKAPTVKYTPPKPQPKPQMSMFDLLDAKPEEPDEDEPTDEEIREAAEQIAAEEKAEQPKPTVSPVYQKYLDVQGKYPQAIVAMRLGDFYEVFGDNAKLLADELDLTLTGRDCGLESRVPMVGFPYHASDASKSPYTAFILRNAMSAIWNTTISVTALTSVGTQKNYSRAPNSLRTASGIPPIRDITIPMPRSSTAASSVNSRNTSTAPISSMKAGTSSTTFAFTKSIRRRNTC